MKFVQSHVPYLSDVRLLIWYRTICRIIVVLMCDDFSYRSSDETGWVFSSVGHGWWTREHNQLISSGFTFHSGALEIKDESGYNWNIRDKQCLKNGSLPWRCRRLQMVRWLTKAIQAHSWQTLQFPVRYTCDRLDISQLKIMVWHLTLVV